MVRSRTYGRRAAGNSLLGGPDSSTLTPHSTSCIFTQLREPLSCGERRLLGHFGALFFQGLGVSVGVIVDERCQF